MPRLAALLLALLLPARAASQSRAPAIPDSARLTRATRLLAPAVSARGRPPARYSLQERMAVHNVPAVSIAVLVDGRIVAAKAWGTSDADAGTLADTTTLFQAGSISKPVAAIAALRLWELGRLDLDADVNQFLKSWKLPASPYTAGEKVTVRRLLTHSAGLTVWGFPGYAPGRPVPTMQQILDGEPPANTRAIRNDTVPGRRWLYSGGGYTVLQQLLADVGGKPFPTLAAELVLAPLGMAKSTYENPLPPRRIGEAAAGHLGTGRVIPGKRHTYPEMAAAGLWTTPSDLARFAAAVQRAAQGERGPLSARLVSALLTPDSLLALGGNHWGLGLTIDGAGETERFGHGGADEGFISQMVAFRRGGQGAVVKTNGARGGALIQEIVRALATEYGWPALTPVQVDTMATDSTTAVSMAGRYVNFVSGRDTAFVNFEWQNGRIGVRLGNMVRGFWASRDGRFVDPATSDAFRPERDASGRVVAVRQQNLWQGSKERRLVRADSR
jgi:CubicO group peptidase (beta-lactamase class C family)